MHKHPLRRSLSQCMVMVVTFIWTRQNPITTKSNSEMPSSSPRLVGLHQRLLCFQKWLHLYHPLYCFYNATHRKQCLSHENSKQMAQSTNKNNQIFQSNQTCLHAMHLSQFFNEDRRRIKCRRRAFGLSRVVLWN